MDKGEGRLVDGALIMTSENGLAGARSCTVATAVAGVILLVGGVAAPTRAVPSAPVDVVAVQRAPAPRSASYDSQLLALINRARTSRGIKPLKTTPKLAKAAQKWSGRLAASHNLRHDPGLLGSVSRTAGCSRVTALGENVAYTSGSAASMFAMYMNSPGHRANILSRSFTYVGVRSVNSTASWGIVHWNTMKFVRARCR